MNILLTKCCQFARPIGELIPVWIDRHFLLYKEEDKSKKDN